MQPIQCPKCGKINDGTTDFCIYCGTIYEEYNAWIKQKMMNLTYSLSAGIPIKEELALVPLEVLNPKETKVID